MGLRTERHGWSSQYTGAFMPIARFGHWGPPLIYVPSSGGDEEEFARYGMPEDCRAWLDAGRVQIFAIDGRARHNLWDEMLAPVERIRAYAAFERYVVRELMPWVRETASNQELGVVGASYGGFVAANLLLKHPDQLRLAAGLGGVYALWHRLDGHHDEDVYFHTPLEFLPRLEDETILDGIRATRGMALYGAAEDEWLWCTERLLHEFRNKQLPHHGEIWDAPANHHESWWKRQLRSFLGRYYG